MPKANADYTRLADDAEVTRDGYAVRVDRAMAEIDRLLKGHPELAKVKQLISHYAVQRTYLMGAADKHDRYVNLRDNPRLVKAKTTKS